MVNILTNIKANILNQQALVFNVIKGRNFHIKGGLMQNNQVGARPRKHAKPVYENSMRTKLCPNLFK
jgi:hypothetical protein